MKIINYPAMASPQSIDAIDQVLSGSLLSNSIILDPFCGSGQLLQRPRVNGHDVIGIDCSPLAILATKASHNSVSIDKLSKCINRVAENARHIDLDFKPLNDELFWFSENSIKTLTQILFSIEKIKCSKAARRVLWLILSDASRRVSYARENEYKLHRMNENFRQLWKPDPIKIFLNSASTIIKRLHKIISENMRGKFAIHQGDIAMLYERHIFKKNTFDAIITSPPYGDSRSTVGYGQFAKIPLMVLKKSDKFNREFDLSFQGNYDALCLGGVKCFSPMHEIIEPAITDKSISNGMKRYNNDYFARLSILCDLMKQGGVISLIIGDRITNGTRYPLIKFTTSFFKETGMEEIYRQDRYLSHKRLPRTMKHSFNKIIREHDGMNYETILCFRKI